MPTYIDTPTIITYLGGTITGSTCYLWGLEIASGSVDSNINFSEIWVKGKIGDQMFDSRTVDWSTQSSATISGSIKFAVLDYTCFRLSVVMSGGTITDGFDYQVGPLRAARSRAYTIFFDKITTQFKLAAEEKLNMLMPLSYKDDTISDTTETPDFSSDSAPGYY